MGLMDASLTAADLRDVELLDTADVAARLALSSSRVAQLEREGRIAAARTASGRRVFLWSDVEAFLSTRAESNLRPRRHALAASAGSSL